MNMTIILYWLTNQYSSYFNDQICNIFISFSVEDEVIVSNNDCWLIILERIIERWRTSILTVKTSEWLVMESASARFLFYSRKKTVSIISSNTYQRFTLRCEIYFYCRQKIHGMFFVSQTENTAAIFSIWFIILLERRF